MHWNPGITHITGSLLVIPLQYESYYESYNKEFRLTLDQKLEYYIFFNRRVSFFQNYKQQKSVIVELKYNTQYSYKASEVSNQFPFRLSKSSKYVMGIDKIKPYIF